MNRRLFLAAASTLPATQLVHAADGRPQPDPALGCDPWLEIHRGNLTWNIEQLAKLADGKPILAMLKDNAYGHGLVGTARHLESLKAVAGFGVFKFQEALALRDGNIRKPVLHVGHATDAELEELVRRDIMPAICSDRGELLARLAVKLQRPVKVHLYVDTGMGRMGVPYHRALPIVEAISRHKGIIFDGVLTELSEDDALDREQVRRLQELHDQARRGGVNLGTRHAASSAGVFHLPASHLDMVRPGISIYGGFSDDRAKKSGKAVLKPTLSLKTRVIYVKQLRPGDSVQYHQAYVAKRPVWVATLPVGHGDGWPREAVGKCDATIRGRRYPIIALVTANHTMVEIGEKSEVAVGDEAALIGETIDAERVAEQTGISVYSILMHLNPLLPRKFV